ncbi:unnamed protein product [Haemonchus placei]|uniref:Secreted protein n=1 Tax=Haemonchus placei TaxID=6290 RepID=A0A0N4X5U6_HAEPC|nr:unnamed protein product [Haemonchus placei]
MRLLFLSPSAAIPGDGECVVGMCSQLVNNVRPSERALTCGIFKVGLLVALPEPL